MTSNGQPNRGAQGAGAAHEHAQDSERAAADVVRERPRASAVRVGFLSQLGSLLSNWRDIRRSPYGTRPLAVLIFVSLFVEINSAVGGVAFRDILRDVNMEYVGYVRYAQTAAFILLFVGLGIAYYSD